MNNGCAKKCHPDMPYRGIIVEESLENPLVLNDVEIAKTDVEEVMPDHQTPWVKQWTMHEVEITDDQVEDFANRLSASLDPRRSSWYADFKNDKWHYIVFRGKVFCVDRTKPEQYQTVKEYGMSLGIPEVQLDFSPQIR